MKNRPITLWPARPKQRKKGSHLGASHQRLKKVWRERDKKALGG